MAKKSKRESENGEIRALREQILVDAYGEDEQLWPFLQALQDNVVLPADAFVIGEPVSIVKIDYHGNMLRGLTAACLRDDDTEHIVSLAEVRFPEGSEAARHVAAYRMWLGIDPNSGGTRS